MPCNDCGSRTNGKPLCQTCRLANRERDHDRLEGGDDDERTALRCPNCSAAKMAPTSDRSGPANSRYYCRDCGNRCDEPVEDTTTTPRTQTTSPHIESIREYRDGGDADD